MAFCPVHLHLLISCFDIQKDMLLMHALSVLLAGGGGRRGVQRLQFPEDEA